MKKIAIFGVPRSGTSWLSQIFNSHPDVIMRFQPLFSYEHKGRISEHSSPHEISCFFDEIVNSHDVFTLMISEIHKKYPSFLKSSAPTHIAFKETRYLHIIKNMLDKSPDIKIIGIIRNPLATIASWVQVPKEFAAEWDLHREWRSAPNKNQNKTEEFFGFEKWKEATTEFLRLTKFYPDSLKLIRYDRLKAAPIDATIELFDFCDIKINPQVTEFIASSQSMHDSDPYSVYRAKASDDQWQHVLPKEIIDEILRDLRGTHLETFIS